MQLIRKQLDDNNKSNGNDHKYDIIKIKIPENIEFFKDLDCLFGIYSNENISPEYIENIEPIDEISIEEYWNWRLKLNLI